MTHILPHWNWPERKGEITPVHVYTSGTEAELFVNGKSQGRRTKTPGEDFRLVWDSVKYEPGVVKVVSYKDGQKWSEAEVRTTGKPTRLALSADRSVIPADGSELIFVTVAVQDNRNQTVPRTNPLIRFSVEGAGEIVSTDNGNAIDFTPFKSHERHAYNGLALVIVKAKKGESPVKAGGRLFIIDGGFCKAYQPTTGIAGYTLIYNSHGIRLKSHRPFEGVARVIGENADMESDSVVVESFPRRRYVSDTDEGAVIGRRIEALERLLALYRSGEMQQR